MHPNGMPARVGCFVGRLDCLLASLQEAVLFRRIPVVSLSLNHRLVAAMPPASDPLP
jgi:hypothetical protein